MPGRRTAPQVAWGLREGETLQAIQSQIKQYATNHQKFFLSYFPVAPHQPFDGAPEKFNKFKLEMMGNFKPLYLNELLYLDWVIGSVMDELKNTGLLDNTLVIITDDHGEMLGENGGPIGHGWIVTPELANVPLIIMDPANQRYRINDTIGSQVDLLPTILDLLGIPVPQGQLYQGISLYSADAQTDRRIYLNSFRQYAMVDGHKFVCGDRVADANSGKNSVPAKFFAFTNIAARTIFSETNSWNNPVSISTFDAFQENLLQHYPDYCQMIHYPSDEH
jgi:arylsulfatase A-like enzyme